MNSHKTNPEIRTMLERMYEILKARFPDRLTAWDRLMEFLILDHRPLCFICRDNNTEWLFKDGKLIDELMEVYDSVQLRTDQHDHLGEMYFEKFNSEEREQMQDLPSMQDAQNIAEHEISKKGENRTVLDPAVGTGRRLIAAHRVAPDAILFGVDKDLRLLRIALTNCAIHDIKCFLLHADIKRHDIDIETEEGEDNWQYANEWHSCMNKLKGKKKGANK